MPSIPPIRPIRVGENNRMRQLMRPFGISASGMRAQQRIAEAIQENIANVDTTSTATGGPYQRKFGVLERDPSGGVRVAQMAEDPTPGREVYQPWHQDADADGMVRYPNVDVITEVVDMMIANRVFEANATAFQSAKAMVRRALEI